MRLATFPGQSPIHRLSKYGRRVASIQPELAVCPAPFQACGLCLLLQKHPFTVRSADALLVQVNSSAGFIPRLTGGKQVNSRCANIIYENFYQVSVAISRFASLSK